MSNALRKLVGLKSRSYMLTVPRVEENEGLLLLGDPGTGKSQVIHQLLDRIAERTPQEAVVCYDPAGEFIAQHFDPGKDIVLNPLDGRCPYWIPDFEIAGIDATVSAPERQFIAESFFPYPDHGAQNTLFFVKAARSAFAQMLTFHPTPERLVEMLSDEDLIDYCVAGTEHAHLNRRRSQRTTRWSAGDSLRNRRIVQAVACLGRRQQTLVKFEQVGQATRRLHLYHLDP